jgi:F-type H+-transporting ATPase subunit b
MGPGEFLNINFFTALFTLCNFIALFLVLKKFLFKPVMKIIQDRQQEIDDIYAEADKAKAEAAAMQQEYAQKLTAAGQTSEQIVKDAVERGKLREEEIVRQANAEASAIMEKANATIAQEKKKAVNDAKNEISDIAMSIAEKIVGRELTGVDQKKLVDEFIDELGGIS